MKLVLKLPGAKAYKNTAATFHQLYLQAERFVSASLSNKEQTFRLLFLGASISIWLDSVGCVWVRGEELVLVASASGVLTAAWGSTCTDTLGLSSWSCCSAGLCASGSFSVTLVRALWRSGCVSVLSQLGAWYEGWTCVCDGVKALWWRWRGWCSLA